MREGMAWFLGIVASLIALIVLAWFIQGSDFFLYKYFAPQYAKVQRQTFEQSPAHIDGMNQTIQKQEFEYLQADADQKGTLKLVILQEVAGFNEADLTKPNQEFVNKLRNQ